MNTADSSHCQVQHTQWGGGTPSPDDHNVFVHGTDNPQIIATAQHAHAIASLQTPPFSHAVVPQHLLAAPVSSLPTTAPLAAHTSQCVAHYFSSPHPMVPHSMAINPHQQHLQQTSRNLVAPQPQLMRLNYNTKEISAYFNSCLLRLGRTGTAKHYIANFSEAVGKSSTVTEALGVIAKWYNEAMATGHTNVKDSVGPILNELLNQFESPLKLGVYVQTALVSSGHLGVAKYFQLNEWPKIQSARTLAEAYGILSTWLNGCAKSSNGSIRHGSEVVRSSIEDMLKGKIPVWKAVARHSLAGYQPEFPPRHGMPLPECRVQYKELWGPYCTGQYLNPFNPTANTRGALCFQTAKLDSPNVIQFYRDIESPETALFGNFEHCPCGIKLAIGGAQRNFKNAEAAFQAVKVDWLCDQGKISRKDADKLIEELEKTPTGHQACPLIKGANEIITRFKLGKVWGALAPNVMMAVVKAKFTQDPVFAQTLVAQRGKALIENSGNKEGVWSISPGNGFKGSNLLGDILMQLCNDPDVQNASGVLPQTAPIASQSVVYGQPVQSAHSLQSQSEGQGQQPMPYGQSVP